jgi:hypothetical protein
MAMFQITPKGRAALAKIIIPREQRIYNKVLIEIADEKLRSIEEMLRIIYNVGCPRSFTYQTMIEQDSNYLLKLLNNMRQLRMIDMVVSDSSLVVQCIKCGALRNIYTWDYHPRICSGCFNVSDVAWSILFVNRLYRASIGTFSESWLIIHNFDINGTVDDIIENIRKKDNYVVEIHDAAIRMDKKHRCGLYFNLLHDRLCFPNELIVAIAEFI